jgi:hypothetical protein
MVSPDIKPGLDDIPRSAMYFTDNRGLSPAQGVHKTGLARIGPAYQGHSNPSRHLSECPSGGQLVLEPLPKNAQLPRNVDAVKKGLCVLREVQERLQLTEGS